MFLWFQPQHFVLALCQILMFVIGQLKTKIGLLLLFASEEPVICCSVGFGSHAWWKWDSRSTYHLLLQTTNNNYCPVLSGHDTACRQQKSGDMTDCWLTYTDNIIKESTCKSICQLWKKTAFCEKQEVEGDRDKDLPHSKQHDDIQSSLDVHKMSLSSEKGGNWGGQRTGREIPFLKIFSPPSVTVAQG